MSKCSFRRQIGMEPTNTRERNNTMLNARKKKDRCYRSKRHDDDDNDDDDFDRGWTLLAAQMNVLCLVIVHPLINGEGVFYNICSVDRQNSFMCVYFSSLAHRPLPVCPPNHDDDNVQQDNDSL